MRSWAVVLVVLAGCGTAVTAEAQPASIDDLRGWLDASPSASLATSSDDYVEVWWVGWPDHADLCIADPHADLDLGCWSVAPAPTSVDVIGRPDDDDDAVAEAVVRLDRTTFVVRAGELVRERVRLGDGEEWSTEAPPRGPALTTTRSTWSGPHRDLSDGVIGDGPRSLDDATVVTPDGAVCHRFDERWACAEPDRSAEVAVAHVERVVEGAEDGELWVESEACDGGSEEWDCYHAVHYFAREGDQLVERGSVAVRADREVRFSEYLHRDDGSEGWVSSGAGEDLAWDWSPAGAACIEIGRARVERHTWADPDGSPTRTRPRVRYGAAVDSIPRWASEHDLAGAATVDLDLEEDMLGRRRAGPVVEDRRGTFRLEGDGWVRAEACGP